MATKDRKRTHNSVEQNNKENLAEPVEIQAEKKVTEFLDLLWNDFEKLPSKLVSYSTERSLKIQAFLGDG